VALPDIWKEFNCLEELSAQKNQLITLPLSLTEKSEQKKLRLLNVQDNPLEKIPSEYTKISTLKGGLKIAHAQIEKLDKSSKITAYELSEAKTSNARTAFRPCFMLMK
jgi:Leucine-rich repeat (LRR) protein